jgi:hypothetical protein
MHENSELLFLRHVVPLVEGSRSRVLEIGPDGFASAFQVLGAGWADAWDTLDITDDSRLT